MSNFKSCLGTSFLTVDNVNAVNETVVNSSITGISIGNLMITDNVVYNKTNFTNVSSFNIPFDLTKYSSMEIILNSYYSGDTGSDVCLTYNGQKLTQFSVIGQVYYGSSNPIPVYENNTINLLTNVAPGTGNGSIATIKINRSAYGPLGNHIVDTRGESNWNTLGCTRFDGSGYILSTGGNLNVFISAANTLMTGYYQVKNYL